MAYLCCGATISISEFLYSTYAQQNHKNARPYEKGYPLFNYLQILVPSDAKGKKAFHGRLALQPPNNKHTLDEDGGEGDGEDGDGEDGGKGDEGEQDEDDVENPVTSGSGNSVGRLPSVAGPSVGQPNTPSTPPIPPHVVASDPPVTAPAGAVATNNEQLEPTSLGPPTSSRSKRPFSTVDESSTLPPSASQAPSTSTTSASSSKRGRMTGAIALTHIGNNFADFNATFRYGIDKEQERHQARMAERQSRGQECQQAVNQVQETEKYLTTDELAALIEVFEDHNSASTYLGIKTPELRKAWIRRKLVASKMTPSFV